MVRNSITIEFSDLMRPEEFVHYFSQMASMLNIRYSFDNPKRPLSVTLYNPNDMQITEAREAISLYAFLLDT